MPVIIYNKRFIRPIRNGTKDQTIRPKGKRKYKVGQIASLRHWHDKPYRSKQVTIIDREIASVQDIAVDVINGCLEIVVDGVRLASAEYPTFIKLDGFESVVEFREYFREQYGFPFEGDLIKFKKTA